MKKAEWVIIIGPLMYIVIYLINRFIIEVPDIIYIPILIICIIFLSLGIIVSFKKD